jgi:TonB family protein
MSILEPKSNWNEPEKPGGATAVAEGAEGQESRTESDAEASPGRGRSTSRWVDYDTHELLNMISELEDERRWARLREGIWIAILVHLLILSAFTWIPKYVFKVPPVIDPFDAIKERKDLSYLDLPPDALKQLRPKVTVKPVKPPQLDKKMLEELRKSQEAVTTPTTPAPEEQKPPQAQNPVTPESKSQQSAAIPPSDSSKSAIQAPKPDAVPARPNFALNNENPDEQLQQAMRNAARGPSYQTNTLPAGGGLSMHPGAGTGGVEILSNTQGVDFSGWLQKWYHETERTWDPLIPDEVNAPILKSGAVQIRFKVLPNGRVTDMHLEGRSGDTALDRAAWGAIVGSNYPPLPSAFHGPYLELRAVFLYNMKPPGQ